MKLFKSLYIDRSLSVFLIANVLVFILAFLIPGFLMAGKVLLLVTIALVGLDLAALYRTKQGISAYRTCQDRFSNGDDNDVSITVHSSYTFPVQILIIDELPFQFQIRDFSIKTRISPGATEQLSYTLRPVKRGVYSFGALNVFASGPFRLLSRRYQFAQNQEVCVYPSFVMLKSHELQMQANRFQESGIRKYRKLGHSQEFDQVRNYVEGDDLRVVNWKATARKQHLMVNQYQDERARQIYCIIDKGRSMELPFKGMSLLDYSINASLMLSHLALKKYDKAGLVTFNRKVDTFLKASSGNSQLNTILRTLYLEKTAYYESDMAGLFTSLWKNLPNRSLLFLFTNFESLSSLRRQIALIRRLASRHLLVVVFFEDVTLKNFHDSRSESTDDIYTKTAVETLLMEKERIVKELNRYGIATMLTSPEQLTIHVINKYLELKSANRL